MPNKQTKEELLGEIKSRIAEIDERDSEIDRLKFKLRQAESAKSEAEATATVRVDHVVRIREAIETIAKFRYPQFDVPFYERPLGETEDPELISALRCLHELAR